MPIMEQCNMPSFPTLKKAILWCIAHPLGKLIFKLWDSIRKIWLVSQNEYAIFYSVYLEWSREKLYKDIFDHSKIVSVFFSAMVFCLFFTSTKWGAAWPIRLKPELAGLLFMAWESQPRGLLCWTWRAKQAVVWGSPRTGLSYFI